MQTMRDDPGRVFGVGAAVLDPEPAMIAVRGFSLRGGLEKVAERIEASRRILDLDDDWDGEGSPRFDEATWRRASGLVVGLANDRHRSERDLGALPIISESDEGSIDIQWRTSTRNILVNVPRDGADAITFHAHDRENETRDIEGLLDPASNNDWLLRWLSA